MGECFRLASDLEVASIELEKAKTLLGITLEDVFNSAEREYLSGYVQGFEYLIENETVTITGYTGSETELNIPAEIEGLTVTAIGEYAFLMNSDITSVVLPDSQSSAWSARR